MLNLEVLRAIGAGLVGAILLGHASPAHADRSDNEGPPPTPRPAAQPPAAQPPPAYYPPPPPPNSYPVPSSADRPWVIEPWDPERPPPDGYHLRSGINGGMLGGGIALLTSMWLSSVMVGAIAGGAEDDEGIDGDGIEGDDYVPLYIPVGGPFAAINSLRPDPGGMALLILDGTLQVLGLGLLIGGIADQDHRVVRYAELPVVVAPIITGTFRGVGLRSHF